MAYCFSEDCGDYAVTPMLVSPCGPVKCCESAPMCYPCLPRCPKGQVVYCCDKRPCGKSRREEREEEDCCSLKHRAPPEPAPQYCCPTCNQPTCKPVKTKYVIPCYRYEDGRIVRKLPISAFKRNGMQDQEHSKLLGTTNYLQRCPRDVSLECDVCNNPAKVCDPIKVPRCDANSALDCRLLKKKPIEVTLADILDE
ncbi:uncharacterized protein [Epargyreus clarus]|uniref:uncharacterized protein isoform X2 n=1 Tax=Epargyreus clarus TaxID=520877 RepID=UPI003C2C7FAA